MCGQQDLRLCEPIKETFSRENSAGAVLEKYYLDLAQYALFLSWVFPSHSVIPLILVS